MEVLKIFKEYNDKVKDSTLKLYSRVLEKLKKDCDGDTMYKFLNNPKKVLKCLSENHNTRKTAIVAILALLRLKDADSDVIDAYKEEQMKSVNAVNEFYKSGDKSTKQKENWLSLDDLKTILQQEEEEYNKVVEKSRGELKPNTYLDAQNYILLKFHLDYPIRNDLHDTVILTYGQYSKLSKAKKQEGNYLVINKSNAKLILNDYKTEKVYGQKTIELNDEITDVLNEFIKWRSKHGYHSNYLFINKYKNSMNANNITKSFLRLFKKYGKSISTTMLRHIIASDKFGEVNKEKEEMANIMGNSTKTIDEKYIKNDDK